MGMFCSIGCQGICINGRCITCMRISRAKGIPRISAGGVVSELRGTGVSVDVVLHRNLATLGIVVADQPITWMIALFKPVYGGVPVLYLGALVIERNIVESDQ